MQEEVSYCYSAPCDFVYPFPQELGEPNSFKTALLGGRPDLMNCETPFVLSGGFVLNLKEQADSRSILEKALLQSSGFNVVTLAPSRIEGNLEDVLDDVLEEVHKDTLCDRGG